MESVVGIFNSFADAKRGAAMLRSLGIADDKMTVLAPHTSETEIEERVPTSDTEQPGMGTALGGTVVADTVRHTLHQVTACVRGRESR